MDPVSGASSEGWWDDLSDPIKRLTLFSRPQCRSDDDGCGLDCGWLLCCYNRRGGNGHEKRRSKATQIEIHPYLYRRLDRIGRLFFFFFFFLLDGSPSRPTRRLLHGGPNPGGAIITDLGTPPWGKRLRQRDSSLPIWQMEAIGSALIRPAPHSGHRLGPFGVRPVRLRWLKVRRRARLKQKANELFIFFLNQFSVSTAQECPHPSDFHWNDFERVASPYVATEN